MTELLFAVAIYVVVFGIDYLFYTKQKKTYQYVSRRTYVLFMTGQIAVFWLFYEHFQTHTSLLLTELVFVSIFAGLLLLFARQLTKDKVYVCNINERSYRCLTPWYVLVKGAEIVFQQMIYMVVAHSLADLLGVSILSYITFVVILLIMHSVIILGCSKANIKQLSFGIIALSVPIFYIFTSLDMLWPAVYLHGILFVFYWITFSDFDIAPKASTKVDN